MAQASTAMAHSLKLQHVLAALRSRWSRKLATSQFTGVSWHKVAQKFSATVSVAGTSYHVGYFQSDVDAACAYDERLRSLCQDQARLKRSLNFPTQMEALFTESAAEARDRALAARIASGADQAEAQSIRLLQALFQSSDQAADYEIVTVAGHSKVDALFRPKGSCNGGLCLQLKSASASGNRKQSYYFRKVQGYAGMLLLLIPRDLEHNILWRIPGSLVTQTSLRLTLGTSRDEYLRVPDIGRTLYECFHQPEHFPHCTMNEAALQCCASHRMEQQAHRLMARALSCSQFELRKPLLTSGTVDSVLSTHSSAEWNVQEKASRLKSRNRYLVNLWKNGGALGRLAYDEHDFDLLLVAIMDNEALLGMFVFPAPLLAERALLGQKPTNLELYPPWKLPKSPSCRTRHAWQLDYFLDLRGWDGSAVLPSVTHNRLVKLLPRSQ